MLASDRREGIAPWQTGGERIGKLASQILRPPAARRRAPRDRRQDARIGLDRGAQPGDSGTQAIGDVSTASKAR